MTRQERPSRLASLSASVRRRITWGTVEVIGSATAAVVPQATEHAWHATSSTDAGVPVKFAKRRESRRLPTPCRNIRKTEEAPKSYKEVLPLASEFQLERAELLERIARLEQERDKMARERDEAKRNQTQSEELVQEVKEHLECGVCLLPFCWPVVLDCGHCFCRSCFADWETKLRDQAKQLTCPTCRAPTRAAQSVHALYNVCVAMEDPTSACRRTEEDQSYVALCEARLKDSSLRKKAATAKRRRSSMVFVANGSEVIG